MILEVQDLRVKYGHIEAVKGISFYIGEKEIVTLVGSNGAGKTTTLKAVAGVVRPSGGSIVMTGRPVNGLPAYEVVKTGLILVPEGRRIFPKLTVQKNLELGAYRRGLSSRELTHELDSMFEMFPILRERRYQLGGTLSGGEQQMLAIARGLMADPKLLLLDEPSMGLAPLIVREIFRAIKAIREEHGVSVFLVEQNAAMAFAIADRGYVMETGRLVYQGSAKELAEDPAIKRAYLGVRQ